MHRRAAVSWILYCLVLGSSRARKACGHPDRPRGLAHPCRIRSAGSREQRVDVRWGQGRDVFAIDPAVKVNLSSSVLPFGFEHACFHGGAIEPEVIFAPR